MYMSATESGTDTHSGAQAALCDLHFIELH